MKYLLKVSAALAAVMALSGAALAGQFTVESGKTKPLRLTADAASGVIGNQNVADVAVHDEHLLLISGKSFGTTNLIVFDKDGKTIYAADVVVTTNTASLVTVNRAGENFSYDCTPVCKGTIMLGDEGAHYSSVAGQIQLMKDMNE